MQKNNKLTIIDGEESFTICLDREIGKGSYARVFFGIDNKSQESIAVKRINIKSFYDPHLLEALKREVSILKQIKGPNIVELKHEVQKDGFLYLFMEYCNGQDLQHILEDSGSISQELSIQYLRDFVNGYKILYEKEIVHRDIKPANLILHNNRVKIADFGFSRHLMQTNTRATTRVGSPLYMAPQLLNDQHNYTNKCDVWSLGITFYEMLFGDTPWPARDVDDLIENIENKPFKFRMREIQKEFKPEVEDLLNKMLKYKEEERISWEEIFVHPLIVESIPGISKSKNSLGESKISSEIFANKNENDEKNPVYQGEEKKEKGIEEKKSREEGVIMDKNACEMSKQMELSPVKDVEDKEDPKYKQIKTSKKSIKLLPDDDNDVQIINVDLKRKSNYDKSNQSSASKKHHFKALGITEISQTELNMIAEKKYEQEATEKQFFKIEKIINDNLHILNIYIKLLIDSDNLFNILKISNDQNLINIQKYSTYHASYLLGKFKEIFNKQNVFKLPYWEKFIEHCRYHQLVSDLESEITTFETILSEYTENVKCLIQKKREVEGEGYYFLEKSLCGNQKDLPIQTFSFLYDKLQENQQNRWLLNIIDSLLLLDELSIDGNIIEYDKLDKKFDYQKFIEEQNNFIMKKYYEFIQKKLENFILKRND